MYKNYLTYLYDKYGIEEFLESDYKYLISSMEEINSLWNNNLKSIGEIKLIILAEAPMWGSNKKYFYNPKTIHSQFFYQSDLEYVINTNIENKVHLISKLNELGFKLHGKNPKDDFDKIN